MDVKPPRIMILYASYGDGHYRASQAIEASFRSKGLQDIVLMDLLAEAHPLLNELTKFVYLSSFKTMPSLYGWAYNLTRNLDPETALLRLLNSLGAGKLKKSMTDHRPDLVIHTFPQLALPVIVNKLGLSLPLVNIMTDFDVHTRWIHSGIDRYYVATEDMKGEMIARGVPEERILVSGIPLNRDFLAAESRKPEVDQNKKPDKKNILLMAGAYGVLQGNRDICDKLLSGGRYRILAVCGRNEELYRGLKAAFSDSPDIHIYGYVNDVARLMLASDCIITKPGGITLSESLACRLPIFLYRPVPGQELNNAKYLQDKGIAFIAHDTNSLVREMDALFRGEERLSRVIANIENLRKPEAAEVIVNDILSRWFGHDAPKPSPVQIGSVRPRLVIH